MDFKEKIELIKRFDYYVKNRCTGKPNELAEKLRTSPRTVFRLKETVEYLGAEIEYNPRIESYYYRKEGCLRIYFDEYELENPPPLIELIITYTTRYVNTA